MMPLPHHRIEPGEEVFSSPSHTSVKPRRQALKVSIVREEFVELTGDPLVAIVLNQLFYWTQRVKDFDLLLEEERTFNPDCNVQPRHGWIYKTASELIEETMLKVTHPTMRKYLKQLVDQGWIDERAHPGGAWNKTTQYRVNLRKIQQDLSAIGHTFPEVYREVFISSLEETQPELSSKEIPNVRSFHSDERNFQGKEKNFDPDVKNFPSNVKNLHSYTYTETTTENTNKEHTQRTHAREGFKNFFIEGLDVWEIHVGQKTLQLTETRKHQLQSILSHYFQNDIQKWIQFCERIKASPFLMGEGPRKWHVTLDWILDENNLLKVLEGNFDDPKIHDQKKTETLKESREEERAAILDSIADPLWREWCTQLDTSLDSRDAIGLWELKEMAPARFLEFDDDGLLWIGSSDKRALNRVDNLRLKLLSIMERTFPKIRNMRTRLEESIPTVSSPPITQTNTINNKGTLHA